MNGRRAKKIRKQCGFKVHKPRKYTDEIVEGKNGTPSVQRTSDMYRQGYKVAKKEAIYG